MSETRHETGSYIIETRNLQKRYGMGSRAVYAVNGIDLKMEHGIHGFIGPNGAGKSTVIKMLVGALSITKGEAFIDGHPVGSIKANAHIGYVSESPKFYHMPLNKYLQYMGRLCGLPRAVAKRNSDELISWLGLEEAAKRDVNGFSAGMKQKAGLAQALIHEPDLLILDEPTANMDPIGRITVATKLSELRKEKDLSIFISSHILGELEKLVDSVSIVKTGRVIMEDKVKNLKVRYGQKHYVLSCSRQEVIFKLLKDRMTYLDDIWREDDEIHMMVSDEKKFKPYVQNLIVKNKSTIESFKKVEITLEDIFLKAVKGEKAPPAIHAHPDDDTATDREPKVTTTRLTEKDVAYPKPAKKADNKKPAGPSADKIAIWRQTFESAWADGVLTPDEKAMLDSLQKTLGLTDADVAPLWAERAKPMTTAPPAHPPENLPPPPPPPDDADTDPADWDLDSDGGEKA